MDFVSGGAITEAGKWLARKGQAFFNGDSRAFVQFDAEGDLNEGAYDDHIHPNEELGLRTNENGVLTGEIRYACEGNPDLCSEVLAGWNKINSHDNVDIKFTKVNPANVRPDVTIDFTNKYKYNAYGYHKPLDNGSSYIYVDPAYVSSDTPLHEFGHLLGFHHAPIYGVAKYSPYTNSLMTPGDYKGDVYSNFTNDEIIELIWGYK